MNSSIIDLKCLFIIITRLLSQHICYWSQILINFKTLSYLVNDVMLIRSLPNKQKFNNNGRPGIFRVDNTSTQGTLNSLGTMFYISTLMAIEISALYIES